MSMVSVVVVTYNSEKTVIGTLDSIYNQTYKDIELIISDDASTDNTINVVEQWVENHKMRFVNVMVLPADFNRGIVSNVNKGIVCATGEYIQIIAGDDLLFKDSIEIKIKHVSDDCIVVGKVELFGEDDKCKEMQLWCERGYNILRKSDKKKYKAMLIDNYIVGPSWGFVPKKIYNEIGIYDERFSMVEDYPFLVKLLKNGYKLKFIDEYVAKYRVYSTSVCQNSKNYVFRDSMDDFFIKEKCCKKQVKTYIFRQLISSTFRQSKTSTFITAYISRGLLPGFCITIFS